MKSEWPADQIERRSVASLVPYARNSRTHSDEQVAQIAASIREWGWTVPILVDEQDGIIAGHGRILAARKLGIADVPVMVAKGWTDAQKKAYVIADNQLALNAGWDKDMLKVELGELKGLDFDLALIGFSDIELGGLLADKTAGLTDPDEVPEEPAQPVSMLGDVWVMGKHRIICGDSTDAATIDKLMGGQLADFVFTSPPYGQQRVYKSGEVSDWDALMRGVFSVLPVKDGAQVLVNLGLVHRENEWLPYWDGWISWMRDTGWRRFGWYIWDQGPGLPGDWNGRLAPSHEFIFHFNRSSMKANKTVAKDPRYIKVHHGGGMRKKDGTVGTRSNVNASLQPTKLHDSVFRVTRHMGRGIEVKHPAVFPVALVEEVSAAYTKEGDTVFEPFSGSGTSVVACEKGNRASRGCELAPAYVDISVMRWQNFSGSTATLESTGETFAEVAESRKPKAKVA